MKDIEHVWNLNFFYRSKKHSAKWSFSRTFSQTMKVEPWLDIVFVFGFFFRAASRDVSLWSYRHSSCSLSRNFYLENAMSSFGPLHQMFWRVSNVEANRQTFLSGKISNLLLLYCSGPRTHLRLPLMEGFDFQTQCAKYSLICWIPVH